MRIISGSPRGPIGSLLLEGVKEAIEGVACKSLHRVQEVCVEVTEDLRQRVLWLRILSFRTDRGGSSEHEIPGQILDDLYVPIDRSRNQEGEDQLILLEETSGDVHVDILGDNINE